MIQPNSQTTLTRILEHQGLRTNVLQMLDLEDIINLFLLNKQIHGCLKETNVSSKIYFSTFLKERETLLSMICNTVEHQNFKLERIENTLSEFHNESLGSVSVMKQFRIQFSRNLQHYLLEKDALLITQKLFKQIQSSSISMPSMRRQTIGDYCNSQFQIFMAELIIKDELFNFPEQPYSTLKQNLLKKQTQLNQQLRLNKSCLLKFRFRPETIDETDKIQNSNFLNLLKCLYSLIDYHLETVRKYLQKYLKYSPVEFLLEFMIRYNDYSDMIIALENNIGFLFQIFTKVFNQIEPELKIYPKSSIWKTLMRKWVNVMRQFETKSRQGFIQLLVRGRQNHIKKYIQKQEILKTTDPKLESRHIMLHETVVNKYKIYSQQLNIIEAKHPKIDKILLSDYSQYTVDVSCNEYSVHWCGHIDQHLGETYSKTEQLIMESTQQIYQNWFSIFGSNPTTRSLFSEDIAYLKNIVKPVTLCKIIKYANSLIIEGSNEKTKRILRDFETTSIRIESVNKRKYIPNELNQQYQQFFDFDKQVSLRTLESIFEKTKRINQEIQNEQEKQKK